VHTRGSRSCWDLPRGRRSRPSRAGSNRCLEPTGVHAFTVNVGIVGLPLLLIADYRRYGQRVRRYTPYPPVFSAVVLVVVGVGFVLGLVRATGPAPGRVSSEQTAPEGHPRPSLAAPVGPADTVGLSPRRLGSAPTGSLSRGRTRRRRTARPG
jgi:hypothetical protein